MLTAFKRTMLVCECDVHCRPRALLSVCIYNIHDRGGAENAGPEYDGLDEDCKMMD